MKPQSIALVMALLTACAPSYGQAVTPGGPQDYQSMMKAMERAQAEANQPGDQRLTCPQLQEQLVVIAQDPAFVAHVKAVGIAAEQDMAQMQVAQGAARMQSRMAQGQQMMAFMPKLLRGQRLIELATARKCEWAMGVGLGVGAPSIPNG
jgi:hypothetical protein